MTTDDRRPLPESWEWTTLKQVAESIRYGHTASANDEPIGPKFLRITDIQNRTVNWDTVPFCECSDGEHEKYRLQPGDIVFARTGATTGKSYLISNCPDAVFASYLIRLRFSQELSVKYFALFFDSPTYWAQIMVVRKGSAQPGVNASILSELDVPLPPLAEQHRIVEAIETQFTRLEAGLAALKQAQARLKRYRAAVLKAACEGRLVPQDPNDEPAAMLLERILAERRAQWNGKGKYKEPQPPNTDGLSELPEGWVWATIEQTADQRLGKMLDKAKNKGIPHPYLRNLNVRWFGFDLTDIKEIRVTDEELENVSVHAGDLVVCEGGEPGRAAVWVREGESMVIQKALHRVRPYGGISPWYLAYRIAADASTGVLERYFTGSTIKHFTGQSLRSYIFPLPPLTEQQRIVAEVERRLSVVEGVEAAIVANLTRAGRLRQAILKKAFAGELVPQDENDEPASVLLERIRGERDGQRTLPGV